jgi:PIN domain nuclease of toxin-antitoxin system
MVSLWEMLIKVGKGKLKLANEEGETTYEFLQSICSAHQIAILPLEFSVLTHLADLPTVHHDHFDRALVCQALHHNLVLVTPDHFMHQYGVPILWL